MEESLTSSIEYRESAEKPSSLLAPQGVRIEKVSNGYMVEVIHGGLHENTTYVARHNHELIKLLKDLYRD